MPEIDISMEALEAAWRATLFQVAGVPVRVSQVVVSIIVLALGMFLSYRAARIVARRLQRLPGIQSNAVGLVENLVFYVLAVAVLGVVLQMVGIPLSTFAFLGGAIAIGLGFGAQNIFNNFISGLILIVERPIRRGDLIQIEDDLGKVEDIGARCARIRRVDGVDLLVPNSKLIENTVVNWTLTDRRIRTTVRVGVAYGSPVRQVAEILESAAVAHARVLEDFPVIVIFDDFGDNSLVFDLYFWAEVGSVAELRQIRSDLRFAIDDAFRAAGIVIAFPQRDVHLDSLGPVEVSIRRDGSAPETES